MPPQTIRIPYDSNLRYLPLVYLLPEELMSRCPTLMKIPRNPYQVRIFARLSLFRLSWLEGALYRRLPCVEALLLHAAVGQRR